MAATAFPAAAIVSGTIATPRLGSGTADATSFLRGDSTWAVVPEVTRASLGLATTDSPTFAGATFGTGTITTSQPLSLSQTWDNAATTFTGLQVNATDTASNAASLLMDLQVGGVSKFNIAKDGVIRTTSPGSFNPDIYLNSSSVGIGSYLNNSLFARINSDTPLFLYNGPPTDKRVQVGLNYYLGFAPSGGGATSEPDIKLYRDAAATLAQRNSTNGQKSRLYKTYTSATSGEWLELDAATDASNFDIAASIGSAGGTARGIRIGGKDAAGTFTSWMSFSTAGAATFVGSLAFSGSPVITSASTIIIDPFVYFNATTLGSSRAAVVNGFIVGSGFNYRWSSTTAANGAADTAISRNAAGVVEINNGTAGTLRDLKVRDIIIGNAAVAETPVATHTLIIKDSTGTSYRVLAVAV